MKNNLTWEFKTTTNNCYNFEIHEVPSFIKNNDNEEEIINMINEDGYSFITKKGDKVISIYTPCEPFDHNATYIIPNIRWEGRRLLNRNDAEIIFVNGESAIRNYEIPKPTCCGFLSTEIVFNDFDELDFKEKIEFCQNNLFKISRLFMTNHNFGYAEFYFERIELPKIINFVQENIKLLK